MTTFALDGAAKQDVLISERFKTSGPVDGGKHRNARSLDGRGKMHRAGVVTEIKIAHFESGSRTANVQFASRVCSAPPSRNQPIARSFIFRPTKNHRHHV